VAVTEPTTPGPATCQLATPVLILIVAPNIAIAQNVNPKTTFILR